RPPSQLECFGLASTVSWREHRRAFQAVGLFGKGAGGGGSRGGETLLGTPVVGAGPPPPPPAGSGGGGAGAVGSITGSAVWGARGLRQPRTTPRPRTLFRLAGPDGAVLRVTEHRRGPMSPAFPPASRPLIFDGRGRAGLSFRGYRFSVRVHARAREAALAEVS